MRYDFCQEQIFDRSASENFGVSKKAFLFASWPVVADFFREDLVLAF
jgi:hypothetical protein